ncbi:hypothetical protein BS47DRAFT_1348802 [Hydnum rufescens UP504]|uniref:Endopeptidase S2P n=1 Tax=Hydnum rufescens UP504 TaxID=1448309 RepID=A0A9P6APZ6_9AGAM|nr:hypothetical protein BS47DRAFT_1348802 [Hydnum rufescens UP504]
MSAKAFVLSISLFWVLLHTLKRIVPTKPGRQLILPLQRPRPQLESRLLSNPFYGRTHFTLRSLRLEIVTTGFSESHDALSWRLRNGRLATLTRTIYDMGAFLGVFISVTSVVILPWMVMKLSREYVATLLTSDHSASSTMHGKRSGTHLAVNNGNSGTVIEPIIPGLTVPLFHLPMIILAVFVCLIVHESGHALSAALNAVPMHSAGISFNVILPGAFVSLSSASMKDLPPWPRIRIASGGAWHNIVFWALLWFASFSGMTAGTGRVVSWLGWKYVGDIGRVVLSIDKNSPLRQHMPIGTLIMTLDDTKMISPVAWSDYLLHPEPPTSAGWCVSRSWLREQPKACCVSSATSSNEMSCFVESVLGGEGRCLNPLLVMDPAASGPGDVPPSRCDERCALENQVCLRPQQGEELLRIGVEPPPWMPGAHPGIIIWRGPKHEVWDQVEIGNFQPRHWMIPIYLPMLISTFLSYLSIVNISLFAFNLAPLSYLDGCEILDASLDLALKVRPNVRAEDSDPEAISSRSGQWRKLWKDRLRRIVTISSNSMMLVVIVLTLAREIA